MFFLGEIREADQPDVRARDPELNVVEPPELSYITPSQPLTSPRWYIKHKTIMLIKLIMIARNNSDYFANNYCDNNKNGKIIFFKIDDILPSANNNYDDYNETMV